MAVNLTDQIFNDADKAREYFEALHWPNGPVCPHCGELERVYRLHGKSHRPGLVYCNACNEAFTVTVGTVMERSHIPLHKWALGFRLMASSKKGVSAHQLHRSLGITYKAAWFMAHRIREAMREDELAPFGGNGGPVEVDETFIGREPGVAKGRAYHHKMKVLSLIDRDSGRARSTVINDVKARTVAPLIRENLAKEARLMTDENSAYKLVGREFASHGIVHHKHEEYVSWEDQTVHTNTTEGYFSIFKRGMKGVYQHCGKQHLHRYLAEFDFRYSNRVRVGVDDEMRAARVAMGAKGKRLTYRNPDGAGLA